jgi:hypothetical protein
MDTAREESVRVMSGLREQARRGRSDVLLWLDKI